MVSTTWSLCDNEHANLSTALLLSVVLADIFEFCKLLSWLALKGRWCIKYLYIWSMEPVLQRTTVSVVFHSMGGDSLTIAASSHAVAMIACPAYPPLDRGRTPAFHFGNIKCCRLHCSFVNWWNVRFDKR
jgi:hypothetical protein